MRPDDPDAPTEPAEPPAMLDPDASDRFAALAHDVSDAIDVIAREADLVDRAVRAHAPASTYSAMRRIARNAAYVERMMGILPNLDRGRRAPVRLGPLVTDVVDRSVCTRERDRVHCTASCDLIAWIDVLAIERVVAGFLRSTLARVEPTAPIWVRVDRGASLACVSVIDRGGGIPPNDRQRLFATQHPLERDRAHCLYDCRLIVEDHGGRVGVDSVTGRGTRIYFELPAHDGNQEASAHLPSRVVPDHLEILLVDDNRCRMWPLADLLRVRGIHASLVAEERELEGWVGRALPDVMIVEVASGCDIVARASYLARLADIPMVAIAEFPADHADVAALVRGGAYFLRRPIDVDALLAKIAILLEQR